MTFTQAQLRAALHPTVENLARLQRMRAQRQQAIDEIAKAMRLPQTSLEFNDALNAAAREGSGQ